MRKRKCPAVALALTLLVASAAAAQQPTPNEVPAQAVPEQADAAAEGESQQPADEVAGGGPLAGDTATWTQLLTTLEAFWNLELYVVDDRVLRSGHLVSAAAVFCLVLIVGWLGQSLLRRTLLRHLGEHAEDSHTLVDDSLLIVVRQTKRPFVFVMAAYLALITLPLSGGTQWLLNAVAIVVVTTQIAIWASAAITGFIDKTKKRRVDEDPSATSAFGLLSFFARVAVWSAALLLILTNLGYEIAPLLAGLGVGGVAVAFALQNILGDIFCSIAIVLDKPFLVGDFIIVNDLMGTVENIGIKTTRLRSLSGEQIVCSNADLIGSRIRNYKHMWERRVVFSFGVVYEISLDTLQQIPAMVRTIIEEIEQARFDRAHFKEYGDFSLNFEVVYYVSVPEYNVYMDIQQQINLRLFREFQEQGIAFAYPTREIIVRPNGTAGVATQPHSTATADSGPEGS